MLPIQLEAWFKSGTANGFNPTFPLLPQDLVDSTTSILPISTSSSL
jgi:hypothetical protein